MVQQLHTCLTFKLPAAVLLQPHAVTAKKMGVGACAWEGEMLLAAYLLSKG
jgi:hypothetical protein